MWRSRSFLGLELKDDVLKIVELSKSGRGIRLERFVYERLPSGWISEGVVLETELLNEFIQDVVSREAFQTRKVHMSIDSPHFLLMKRTYPAMKKKSLRKVIALEIAEQMELPFDDPWYEVISLRKPEKKEENGEWQVLLILTSEAFVRTHVQLIRSCGLKPVGVDLSPLAIHRWLKYVRPEDELPANVLIANLSTRGANVSVFMGDVLATSCFVPLSMLSFQSDEKAYQERDVFPHHLHTKNDIHDYTLQLATKVTSAIHGENKISEWVLTGEGVPLFEVRQALSEKMNMRITVLSGEIPVNDSLLYRPMSRLKPGLCLPMGLALKGLVRL